MQQRIGKYEILEEIGIGGMAVVYKARDTVLDRIVALKVINQKLQTNEVFYQRFLNEAKVAAGLTHNNIVVVHELGMEDGKPFIAMEYLPGSDLRELIDRRQLLTLRQKINIAIQIARALQHAQSRGVIHRDVKPANIRLLPDGTVKLMDFGIAKITSEALNKLTKTGALVGTVSYMSPEQLQGGAVSSSTDVFSFGLVLYELLLGVHPFETSSPTAIIYRILSEPMPKPSAAQLPEAMVQLLEDCLEKSPQQRIESFEEVIARLLKIKGGTRKSEINPESSLFPAVQQTAAAAAAAVAEAVRTPLRDDEPTAVAEASTGIVPRRSPAVWIVGLFLLVPIGLLLWMFLDTPSPPLDPDDPPVRLRDDDPPMIQVVAPEPTRPNRRGSPTIAVPLVQPTRRPEVQASPAGLAVVPPSSAPTAPPTVAPPTAIPTSTPQPPTPVPSATPRLTPTRWPTQPPPTRRPTRPAPPPQLPPDPVADPDAPGTLRLILEPWAFVRIDGGEARQSPLRPIPLEPGQHRIQLFRDGFRPIDRTVVIESGQTLTLELGLQPMESFGSLKVFLQGAPWAYFRIDNGPERQLPHAALRLSAGEHILMVYRNGYRTVTRRFEVLTGRELDLQIELQPE